MNIQPFTYYRTADNRRAFLVTDVQDPTLHATVKPDEARVVLLEWGKARASPEYRKLDEFRRLIEEGKLLLFTPKL